MLRYYEDGSRDKITSRSRLELSFDDPDMFEPAPEKCDEALGVRSLKAGETTIRIEYKIGGKTLSTPIKAEVLPYYYSVDIHDFAAVRTGEDRFQNKTYTVTFDILDENKQPLEDPPHGPLETDQLQFESQDPSIATAETYLHDGTSYLRLHGESPGTTSITATYGIEAAKVLVKPGTFEVKEGGTIGQLIKIRLKNSDGFPLPMPRKDSSDATPKTGTCFTADLIAGYIYDGSDEKGYVAPVADEVAWTAKTETLALEDESAGKFCAQASGTAVIEGCVGGDCKRLGFYIEDDNPIESLKSELRTDEAVESKSSTVFCAPVRVHAKHEDGTSEEVTLSGGIHMLATVPVEVDGETFPETFYLQTESDGTPVTNTKGDPCLKLRAGNWPMDRHTVSLLIKFAGLESQAEFDVIF